MMRHLRQFLCRLVGIQCASGVSSTSDLRREMKVFGSKAEAETIALRNQRQRQQRDRGDDALLMLTDMDEGGNS